MAVFGDVRLMVIAGTADIQGTISKDMSQEKRSSFDWLMAVVSVGMLAAYTRSVFTVDDSASMFFALVVWAIMLVIWLGTAIDKTWPSKNTN